MKRVLRNFVGSFLLALSVIGFQPIVNPAAASPPDEGCAGAYGGLPGAWTYVYSCTWGCEYYYVYGNYGGSTGWVLVDWRCDGDPALPP